MTFKEKLVILRKAKGLTQAELVNILVVSNQAVSKWERGLSCPDILILNDLAAVLGVPVQELLVGDMEEKLKAHPFELPTLTEAKKMGFSDKYIAKLWNCTEMDVYNMRKELNLFPVFKMVDTCHTGAYIPYFYSSYTGQNVSRLTIQHVANCFQRRKTYCTHMSVLQL